MITETEIYFPTDWRAVQIHFWATVKGCGWQETRKGKVKKKNNRQTHNIRRIV